jgi:thioredoxin 1
MKFEDIIHSNKTVLVDFFATWCAPCKTMAPILSEVKQKLGDDVTIVKIDIDKNPQVARKYQVQSVPTLIIFKDGLTKWRKSGVIPARELEKIIKTNH